MLALITVGSTHFDPLVSAALSTPVLTSLRAKGFSKLTVQCGNSKLHHLDSELVNEREGVEVDIWRFKPSLMEDYRRADLVISHAGSGTILDVLRLGKPLIVVPNPTLLHNHQEDLAVALENLGHLKASSIANLPRTIDTFDLASIVPFPPHDGRKFQALLDEEMGFL